MIPGNNCQSIFRHIYRPERTQRRSLLTQSTWGNRPTKYDLVCLRDREKKASQFYIIIPFCGPKVWKKGILWFKQKTCVALKGVKQLYRVHNQDFRRGLVCPSRARNDRNREFVCFLPIMFCNKPRDNQLANFLPAHCLLSLGRKRVASLFGENFRFFLRPSPNDRNR